MKNLMVLLCSAALLCVSASAAWADCGGCDDEKGKAHKHEKGHKHAKKETVKTKVKEAVKAKVKEAVKAKVKEAAKK